MHHGKAKKITLPPQFAVLLTHAFLFLQSAQDFAKHLFMLQDDRKKECFHWPGMGGAKGGRAMEFGSVEKVDVRPPGLLCAAPCETPSPFHVPLTKQN